GPLLRERGRGDGGRVSGVLKLGTRGSRLALWQAEWVQAALARQGVAAELVVVRTRGDAEVDRPLRQLAGKGFFTKEIEDALLGGRIDAAVHSLKDLPTRLPDGLALGAVPARADPAEALVTREPGVACLAALPAGVKVGTSSLRRVAQIRYLRPDLEIVALRGNVPTRVQKVAEGRDGLAAALLAAAGLERLELGGRIAARLAPLVVMPAPGQGALGLEVRSDDRPTRPALAPPEDAEGARHVAAALRRLVQETHLVPSQLVWPLFVCHGSGVRREVGLLPGVSQTSVDELVKDAERAHRLGLGGIILFGLPAAKDATGSESYDEQ